MLRRSFTNIGYMRYIISVHFTCVFLLFINVSTSSFKIFVAHDAVLRQCCLGPCDDTDLSQFIPPVRRASERRGLQSSHPHL